MERIMYVGTFINVYYVQCTYYIIVVLHILQQSKLVKNRLKLAAMHYHQDIHQFIKEKMLHFSALV